MLSYLWQNTLKNCGETYLVIQFSQWILVLLTDWKSMHPAIHLYYYIASYMINEHSHVYSYVLATYIATYCVHAYLH